MLAVVGIAPNGLNDTLVLKNGHLAAVFQISGKDYTGMDDNLMSQYHRARNEAIRQLPPNVIVTAHIRRVKESQLESESIRNNEIAEAINRRWHARFKFSYRNKHYLAITTTEAGLLDELAALQSIGRNKALRAETILEEASRELKSRLSDYRPRRLIGDNLCSFLSSYLNAKELYQRHANFFQDLLSGADIVFPDNKPYQIFEGASIRYAAWLSIKSYEDNTTSKMLDEILRLQCEFTIYSQWQTVSTDKAFAILDDKRRTAQSWMRYSDETEAEFAEFIQRIESKEVGLCYFTFALQVKADSLDELDQGGAAKYLTGCQNSDVTSPIVTYREYNGVCKNLIDVANLNVILNYRTMTRLGDKTLEVKGCQYDDQNVSLEATYEGCEQRHDFLVNKTFEQERLYYLYNGERNYATGCRDSETVYNHYLTTATCSHQNANGKVIVNKRIAYNQADGTVGYATNCKPVSDELLIEQEFCDYEHDFIVNQSYRQERDYFLDPVTKERVYLTNCSRANQNFPHKEESDGWVHDDSNLRSSLRVRLYFIDTTISQTDKIYPNGDSYYNSEQTVPYANKGTFARASNPVTVNDLSLTYSNTVYRWNNNVLNISLATPYASGSVYSGGNSYQYCAYQTGDCYSDGDHTNCSSIYVVNSSCFARDIGFGVYCGYKDESNYYYGEAMNYCYIRKGYAKIAKIEYINDYLRPDGSIYSLPSGESFYQVQP
ncbi:MAG: hypothetical protein LBP89_01680 [Helicobacteraceae bacterium]|jgi:hypothetical protein|nr:hypothetical protein [Helicobacteraceae bacterium]